jgi:predicted dehydrogenase
VAFVGAGPIGIAHLKAFRSIGVEVVGLCTKGADTGAALAVEHGFPMYASSIRELYERTQADAVVAALPIAEMLNAYRELFAFPWASLTEKPMGVDLREAREIASIADFAHHRGYVGFNRRHYQATRTALHAISTRTAPRVVTVLDQQDRDQALRSGHPLAVAENFMYANSIHLIDYFSMFCRGTLSDVRPLRPWTGARGCTVEVELAFNSGDVGRYKAVWEQKGPWAVEVTSGDITAVMRPLEKLALMEDGRDVDPFVDFSVDENFKPGFVVQAESFIDALSGNPGCPTIDDAIATTELVSAIYQLS